MEDKDNAAIDFDPEEDDLLGEESADEYRNQARAAVPGNNSAITGGVRIRDEAADRTSLTSFRMNYTDSGGRFVPERSVEGWVVIVTEVHEEAQVEDLKNTFGEFGLIKDLHLNLERRTGYTKGYALIEFEKFNDACRAIDVMDGRKLLTRTIHIDWAFCKGPVTRRSRSRSPKRRF